MALATPTTKQISDNVIAQLEASLSQTIPLLPRAFLRVIAKVTAGVYVTIYKYAGFSLLQMFVARATFQTTEINGQLIRPLVEWGRLVGVGDPIPATQAELEIDITVLSQVGSLPAGTQLLNTTTGVVYQTTAAVDLDSASVSVNARASSDQDGGDGSGEIGNMVDGQTLKLASAPATVAATATVASTVSAGAEAEEEDAYRARVVRRFQRRAQGGAYSDYQQWGTEVAGVRNVYPYTGSPGQVDVYVEAVAGPDGIPDSSLLEDVLESIEFDPDESPSPTGLANRRPANAAINVLAITRTEFDVDITGFESDDESSVLASIEQGVDEYLRAREPFIVGLSSLPRLDRVTQGAVAGVVNEIAEANGASVANVILRRGVDTVLQYTLAHGETAKLGTLTSV